MKYRGVICAVLSAVVVALGAGSGHAQAVADTIHSGQFDYGKMWTFEYAPAEYFTETYGFAADPAWFERARLSALRIPGCSASFVSPNGLLATNHHCVRSAVSRVTRPGETLLDSGFYAASLEEERRIPGYYADQLIAIEDVSDEVFAAVDRAAGAAREQEREAVFERVQSRLKAAHTAEGDSVRVQIISLYHGGRYSAYVFRRFTDVRMVFAVELQAGFFGGDPDNFTYPRYALDFAFLRAYDNDGNPHQTEHYFGWGEDGVEQGDVVFVIGNPGPTSRLNTIAQLEFQRDVSVRAQVTYLAARLTAMREFAAEYPTVAEEIGLRNRSFSLSNSLKANTGRLEALEDPDILARKADAERQLREAIAVRTDLSATYGAVLDRIAALQEQKREVAAAYGAFLSLANNSAGSRIIRRALTAQDYLAAGPGEGEVVRDTLLAIDDHPAELEHRLLTARFADFERYYGAAHEITRAALHGLSPAEAASDLMRSSALADADRTRAAVEAGTLGRDDPAIRLVAALLPHYDDYRRQFLGALSQERELASDLGRARFAVYGRDVPPDATSSPRITDGVVLPYEYNGTLAPPYTTFFGMYDRYYSHEQALDWELPGRWQTPPAGFDLGTPLNFVSTADTYGGNSGSPAVTPELRLVGLNFDRNIDGLSRDFIYLPERGRNIMVDARAIYASLDVVYDAQRIVGEITTGRLFRTEEEAAAVRR
jgi:hypothetical protein